MLHDIAYLTTIVSSRDRFNFRRTFMGSTLDYTLGRPVRSTPDDDAGNTPSQRREDVREEKEERCGNVHRYRIVAWMCGWNNGKEGDTAYEKMNAMNEMTDEGVEYRCWQEKKRKKERKERVKQCRANSPSIFGSRKHIHLCASVTWEGYKIEKGDNIVDKWKRQLAKTRSITNARARARARAIKEWETRATIGQPRIHVTRGKRKIDRQAIRERPSKGQKFVLFACALRDIFEGRDDARSCRLATVVWRRPQRRQREHKIQDPLVFFLYPARTLFSLRLALFPRPPLDSSPSGGRHLNWTMAIAPKTTLLSRKSIRVPEKASSLRVPFSPWRFLHLAEAVAVCQSS